jgi:hypothetical protein
MATRGKWNTAENRSNNPSNRWQPTATASERMVRRGTVLGPYDLALRAHAAFRELYTERLAEPPFVVSVRARVARGAA